MRTVGVLQLLTLTLLTWTKWWAPANASKWRMGFNSAFKGLRTLIALDPEFVQYRARSLV